jgi:flagellar basal-body rod modification protein FlgD
MNITNINSNTSSAFAAQNAADRTKMGQQQFLQLLVAQMRHQDSSNPMNGAEFASQLAQFNSVEQLISVNSGIQMLQQSQDLMSAGLTNSLAASLTGKEVRAISDTIHLPSGEGTAVNFRLSGSASEVTVVIRNSSGNEVRRETLPPMNHGDNKWQWDGNNGVGDRMPDGNYTVSIEASSGDTNIAALTFLEGIAKSVRFTGQGVFMTINGVSVPIGDVEEIRA